MGWAADCQEDRTELKAYDRLTCWYEKRWSALSQSTYRSLSRGFHELEAKELLSADGALAQSAYSSWLAQNALEESSAFVSPMWFEDFRGTDVPLHINSATSLIDGIAVGGSSSASAMSASNARKTKTASALTGNWAFLSSQTAWAVMLPGK